MVDPVILVGGTVAVVALLFLLGSKKGPSRRHKRKEVKSKEVEELVEKPGTPKIVPEESVPGEGGLEALLAGEEEPREEEAPTSIEAMLAGEEPRDRIPTEAEEKPPKPMESKKEPPIITKKGLIEEEKKTAEKKTRLEALSEKAGEEIDLEELAQELEEPEPRPTPPKYAPHAAEAPKPKSPAKMYERSGGLFATLFGKKGEKPAEAKEKTNPTSDKHACMMLFDEGKTISQATREMARRMGRKKAQDFTAKVYNLWNENRAPLLEETKETRDKIKRVEYKYLKRQIDEKTRNDMLNEAQKKLIDLEARLDASEDFFKQ